MSEPENDDANVARARTSTRRRDVLSGGPAGRIVVVEDEPPIAASMVRGLKAAGFDVELATDGRAGVRAVTQTRPDLVVLDLNLPELDGFEFLKRIQTDPPIPVIVVTARTGLDDRLRSFNLGAIDYLAKPFWIEELITRIRVRLRPPSAVENQVHAFDDVVVDVDGRFVTVAGQPAALTPQEFEILVYLVRRPGRAVSRRALAELSPSPADDRDDRTVDSHVARVRKKLGAAGARIATVWGIGYRFEQRSGE